MRIEKTDDEIVIRLPATTNLGELKRLLDYIRFKEITSKSKATDEQIESLARESKSAYWIKNKKRFG